MKYVALIYSNESDGNNRGEDFQKKLVEEYWAYEKWLDDENKGCKLGGHALQPIGTATTVRIRDGKTLTTDGPFAETKEQLGGFYLLEAKDLDDAVRMASRIPSGKFGSIEIRPVMEFN